MINRLTDGLDFQAQALNLRSRRQRLLASNIANVDTPGYQARDLDFASALRQASGEAGPGNSLATPHAAHLLARNDVGANATLRYATASQPGLDNNTVDMDRERASFADNTVKYEATLRFINAGVRNMLDAMRSPNQG